MLAKNWTIPVKWNRLPLGFEHERPKVFPSLCDWLDNEVPVEWLGRFLHLIDSTPNIDWMLLTKRPQLFRTAMEEVGSAESPWSLLARRWLRGEPPENVWLGVSVEDQKRAEERIPLLLETPARLRWLSVEPLLGPVDLRHVESEDGSSLNSLTGDWGVEGRGHTGPQQDRVDWVVVGGESGPKARVCHADWIRSLVRQCDGARVPVFVKQVGSNPVDRGMRAAEWGTLRDRKGGDPDEWPKELRVRQFPDA